MSIVAPLPVNPLQKFFDNYRKAKICQLEAFKATVTKVAISLQCTVVNAIVWMWCVLLISRKASAILLQFPTALTCMSMKSFCFVLHFIEQGLPGTNTILCIKKDKDNNNDNKIAP